MKLSYRTAHYDYTPPTLEVTESEILGKYRGVTYRCNTLKEMPVPQPDRELSYRGVAYHTNPSVEACRRSVGRSSLEGAQAVRQLHTHASPKAVHEMHLNNLRRNLERRLRAAKERGDQRLVEMLESESRQLIES